MNLLRHFFRPKSQMIYIVSGLPRSGTSLMMKMLESGGLEVLTDHIRVPNEDNPKGYYEFERAKKLPDGDIAWLKDAQGRVVKIIAGLLMHLPDTYSYRVIFMRRHMAEILASQKKMLENRGEDPNKVNDEDMARLFEKHLEQVYAWMQNQSNLTYLDADYNALLRDPHPIVNQVTTFLDAGLDAAKMLTVVDPTLYRQRQA